MNNGNLASSAKDENLARFRSARIQMSDEDRAAIRRLSEERRAVLTEMQHLMRKAFYASLNRRVPTSLLSLPSYVRSVQKHFDLPSRNQARAMLAQVEGFRNWKDVMEHMLHAVS